MAAIPNSDQYKKTLPKDQQKLQDAAATNSGSSGVMEPINSNAAFKLLEGANDAGGIALAGAGALNFAAKKTGSAALAGAGGTLGAAAPYAAALYGGYQAGTALDKAFDVSGKIASGVGSLFGMDINKGAMTEEEKLAIKSGRNPAVEQKGNIVEGPITPSERGAIDAGLNANKPIKNPMGLSTITGQYGAGNDDNVIAYEPLARKSQEELATAATEDYASQFEGAYQNKDGSYTGLTTAGGERSMTPEQYASYAEQQKLGLGNPNAVPMGDYTPVAGTQGSVQQPLNNRPPVPPVPPAPQAPQETKQIEASSNFVDARDAGTITPDKVIAAQEYAASMGRTFDEKMGYSSEFDPEILASYKARQEAGEFGEPRKRGLETDAQGRMRDPELDAKADAEARATGNPTFSEASAAREARIDEKPDFNESDGSRAQMRVGGKMVDGTPENRALRDIESGLKQEARDAGYTPAQTRAYIADKMKERSQAVEDRAFDQKVKELNFSQAEANLAKTLKSMIPEAEGLDREDFFGIIKGMDALGISRDNETGNLTYNKEGAGAFGYFDKEVNLMPDSDLYQKILGMKGGDKFLAPPKGVQAQAKGQPEGTNIRADDGTGRIWKVTNGELVQVN